jgi:SAM-dependent methyltransferase
VSAGAGAYDGRDLEVLADMPHYQAWVLDLFGAALAGDVVEVGAGIGNLSGPLLHRVRSAVLIEPALNLVERLKERAAHHNATVFGGTLAEACAAAVVQAGAHDAVLFVNVLEHIDDDGAELVRARALLKRNGALLVYVPALPFLFGALDRAVGHVRRYTPESLRRTVEGAGFVIDDLRYVDAFGMVPWFVVGRVLRRASFGGAPLYDRFAVPVLRQLEAAFPPKLGKNLVCVARLPRDAHTERETT